MGFNEDIARGESIEYKILELIKETYPSANKKKGYFKEYDIEIPEISTTVEVKYDEMSAVTGNLVVETEFDGKPSALNTTTADYWLFVTPTELMWIKPEAIWSVIHFHNYKLRRFIGKGDTKYKRAFLVKTDHVRNLCNPVTKHNLFK